MLAMMLPVHVTGGMEIHCLDLARGLAKAGHDVTVVTSRHPQGIKAETIDGVEIHYIDVLATSKRPLPMKAILRFVELHRARRFHVVHSQSFAGFYLVKSGLKRELKVPLVTTLHGTASTEIRSNIHQGGSLMLLPKVLFHTFNHHFRTKELVRQSDAVIAISRELAESIPKEFSISPGRVKTVFNGIDTSMFRPKESALRLPDKRIVLTASVLHKQKGVQYLIKAFKSVLLEVPNARLMVVGDGPHRAELQNLSRSLSVIDAVTFTGKVPNATLPDYYNAADVFVIPTVRVEGLPLVELEAMACARPVVASDIGGIPSVIRDGVNGLLVRPADVGMLAARVVAVLNDRGLAATLSSNARKTIEKDFSREKMVERTLEVYTGVLR